MTNLEWMAGDAAGVARSVRALAKRARLALVEPVEEEEIRSLLDAIDHLERQLAVRSSAGLARWASGLRHRLEERVLSAV